MEYEICYLIGESKEADLDKIRPGVEDIIKKHKGTFLEGEFVKKRRLAYEIKNEKRGTYVARRFSVPSKDERDENFPDYDIMGEINKELRFNQDILRYMLVKTDDLPSLKELELAEEKSREDAKFNRDEKKVDTRVQKVAPLKVEEKKEEVVKEEKAEVKEEVVAIKEEKEEVAVEEEVVVEEKPKKKSKKKEEILVDDIDEKLDEILNI